MRNAVKGGANPKEIFENWLDSIGDIDYRYSAITTEREIINEIKKKA